MTDTSYSGFDMARTIDWYESSGIALPVIEKDKLHCPIENEQLIELSLRDLGGLFHLFPENARKRSILRKVVGRPSTWFHKDSTGDKPIQTTNSADAISQTAIIPSYIDYTSWMKTGTPTADIHLFQIPRTVEDRTRALILSQGFIHELGHSIVQPALYLDDYVLRLPDKKIVNGFEAMIEFATLAENHPPISHYASAYRDSNNKFNSNPTKQKTAISEEMCETIAAYILKFAFCGDDARSRDPFVDRPEIKEFVDNFLNAELIIN